MLFAAVESCKCLKYIYCIYEKNCYFLSLILTHCGLHGIKAINLCESKMASSAGSPFKLLDSDSLWVA